MTEPESNISPVRLEAFSDGVLAIIITIMVLEIHPPHGHDLAAWKDSIPVLLAYLISFIFLAIYWNNHHHLLRATKHITPGVMWANMLLLFFLSLIPVTTGWIGSSENYKYSIPVAVYASFCLLAGFSFNALAQAIIKADPTNTKVAELSKSKKGVISPILYLLSIGMAFVSPLLSIFIIVATSALWFIPDKRLTTAS